MHNYQDTSTLWFPVLERKRDEEREREREREREYLWVLTRYRAQGLFGRSLWRTVVNAPYVRSS